jgi:hypothetical protein
VNNATVDGPWNAIIWYTTGCGCDVMQLFNPVASTASHAPLLAVRALTLKVWWHDMRGSGWMDGLGATHISWHVWI